MKKKGTIAVIIFFISALVLFYFSVAFIFSSRFLPNTFIDNKDVSYKTEEEVREWISRDVDHYTLTITGREDLEDSVTAGEIGLRYNFSDELSDILRRQTTYLWPLAYVGSQIYDLTHSVIIDQDLLNNRVKNLVFFDPKNITEPKDAYISEYDPKTGSYTLIPSIPGSKPDIQAVMNAICTAVDHRDRLLDLDTQGCYYAPDLTEEDPYLQKNLEAMNRFVSAHIVTDYMGDEVELTGKEISQWVEQGPYTAILDRSAVKDYVKQQAKAHDTYGQHYDFTATDGSVHRLASYSFGYQTDRSKEAEELSRLIKAGETIRRTPVLAREAYNKGQAGIGDSYVEINLSAQHLYLYYQGMMVLETDFVSGNVAKGNTTPAGIYGITYKERDATLRGATYTSFVHYWMPFNGDIGMHDATWRSEFGGDIYLTNGSHGCVNLPLSAAGQIYEYMAKGFPVVCFY